MLFLLSDFTGGFYHFGVEIFHVIFSFLLVLSRVGQLCHIEYCIEKMLDEWKLFYGRAVLDHSLSKLKFFRWESWSIGGWFVLMLCLHLLFLNFFSPYYVQNKVWRLTPSC